LEIEFTPEALEAERSTSYENRHDNGGLCGDESAAGSGTQ
jgi:hypothetical protein